MTSAVTCLSIKWDYGYFHRICDRRINQSKSCSIFRAPLIAILFYQGGTVALRQVNPHFPRRATDLPLGSC